MAENTITVAKALTKLKIINRRISDLIEEVVKAMPTHSKTCSLIVSERDINRNHKEAVQVILNKLAAIKGLQKYYVVLNSNILKSNLETVITSEYWGELTVAQALTYCANINVQYKMLDDGVRKAMAQAETLANNYNRSVFPQGIQGNQDEIKQIMAQPVLLIDADTANAIKLDKEVVYTELNDLINQSNAVTTIPLPEGTPDFLSMPLQSC